MSWIENRFEEGLIITSLDFAINWGRKNSIWPMTFGLACCAIEMMAVGGSRFDLDRFGAGAFRATPKSRGGVKFARTRCRGGTRLPLARRSSPRHRPASQRGPMTYTAPVADILFTLNQVAGLDAARREGLYGDLGDDLIAAIAEEAGKFANEVIAPLNRVGDAHGTMFKDGAVTMPPGWKEAYRDWAAAGWNGLSAPAEWGGRASSACRRVTVRRGRGRSALTR